LLFGTALVLFGGAPALSAADTAYPERERIAKSFSLASGSRVELLTIAGPVEIDTTSGRTADVEVVRAAPTRRDLDCGAIVIEQIGSTLTIRSETRCDNVRSSHTVKLSVPRDVDLNLRNIAGRVRIGPTDGMVRLESIAGHVEAAGLREARMISLARGLSLTVSDLSDRGVNVTSVMGGIDLDVGPRADAEVITRSVEGDIDNGVPGARITEIDKRNQRAVIGSGRGKIEIVSVVGTIKIRG
jgi:hypothetical protein